MASEMEHFERFGNASRRLAAVAYRGGVGVFKPLPPRNSESPTKNRAKLNPIAKTVKEMLNLGCQHTKMFGKKAVKF